MNNSWSLAQVWNKSLDNVPQRELVARDYCYASELGGSFYDRYWKMKGRQPTTPPNLRARRKFEGGNMAEWMIQQVLHRAGVLKGTQEHFEYTEGAIKVTGRCDFEAGGEIQHADFSDLDLPQSIKSISEATVAALQEKYPEGLAHVNIEIKSCSGMIFDRYELAPAPQHALQSFIQAKVTNRSTLLVYVSRDDMRICEWKILPDMEKYQKLLDKDLDRMAELAAHPTDKFIMDFREPLLQYVASKFSSNWKVEYSSYLDDYGFEYPEQYGKPAKSVALRLNNIVKRLKEGKEMTKVNLNTLEVCYEFYPEAEKIIEQVKEKHVTQS